MIYEKMHLIKPLNQFWLTNGINVLSFDGRYEGPNSFALFAHSSVEQKWYKSDFTLKM